MVQKKDVSFDKILNRIKKICNEGVKLNIDSTIIAQKVCMELYDGVSTKELDELTSQISIAMYSQNLDYGELASRILISNHHKNTESDYSKVIEKLYNKNLINEELYKIVKLNIDNINKKLNYKNDYLFDYFGFKTLEISYLLRIDKIIVRDPNICLCVYHYQCIEIILIMHLKCMKDYQIKIIFTQLQHYLMRVPIKNNYHLAFY